MPPSISGIFFYLTLTFFVASNGFSQTSYTIDASSDYYYRILQINGIHADRASFNIRPFEPRKPQISAHPWSDFQSYEPSAILDLPFQSGVYLFEPVWFQSVNSHLPRGINDGPLWQGRGVNHALSAGVRGNFGPLHIQFKPVIGFSQNYAYDLGPHPVLNDQPYASRVMPNIDYVRRYGDGVHTFFDLGDSYIDLRFRGFHTGLSNERIWTGPSTTYPLIFSYNAPGFSHAFLGTYHPVVTPVGAFEFRYVFGAVRKSDYFGQLEGRKLTAVNALTFSYSPWFAKGLSVGAVRLYMDPYPTTQAEFRRQISKIFDSVTREGLQTDENPVGWEPDNQMITVFLRWFFPQSGFEFYTEYGRNDHNADWRDLRMQPDHMRAYLFGAIKSYELSDNRLLAINAEMIQTETTRSSYTRGLGGTPTNRNQLGFLGGWYTHDHQRTGFTNQGQPLGAGIGPGGNARLIRADMYHPKGKYGIKMARIVYFNSLVDNTSRNRNYYSVLALHNPPDTPRWKMRNVEFMVGLEAMRMLPYGLELSATIEQSYVMNQHYIDGNDMWNTRLELVLRKRIKGALR